MCEIAGLFIHIVYWSDAGLLNVDDHELVQHLLRTVEARLNAGIQDSKGLAEFRLLLRLLACLTCFNVIDAAQLLSLITQLVQTCVAIVEESRLRAGASGWQGVCRLQDMRCLCTVGQTALYYMAPTNIADSNEEPELWQPYADQLLHALLSAIPFCPDDSPSFLKEKINVSILPATIYAMFLSEHLGTRPC